MRPSMTRNSDFRGKIGRQIRVQLKSTVSSLYFWYWSWKSELLHLARFSSLVVLIASASVPLLEMLLEVAGKPWLAAAMAATEKKWSLRLLFIFAVAFIAWHNWAEMKKPTYEYTFVKRLREVLHHSRTGPGVSPLPIRQILAIFHSAFSDAVLHVCISHASGGELVIDPYHVFPEENNPDFYERIPIKEGVAGRVYDDHKIRYVPRMFFPGWEEMCTVVFAKEGRSAPLRKMPFPHAVTYTFEDERETYLGTNWNGTRLVEEEPDWGHVQMPTGESEPLFKAFLCVPLKTRGDVLLGVLNFDFRRIDPLDKSEIEMALVFGLTLADELQQNEAFMKSIRS